MQPETKNMPFNACRSCGNEKMYVIHASIPSRWKNYWIECSRCGFCTPNAHTMRGAIKKWNKANSQVVKAIKVETPPHGTKGEDA